MGLRSAGARALPWAAAGLVAFWALMLLRPLPAGLGAAAALGVQCATVLVACVLMGVRARRARGALRRARGLLAASLLLATLGGVLALVLPSLTGRAVPTPSLADAVHFAYVPLCVAGVLSYPVSPDEEGSRTRALLDGLVAAAALWFATYVLLLAPARVGAGLPPLTSLTLLAYPAADVFVIAMAAGAVHRVAPAARRELALAGLGVSLYGVSDIAYTVLASQDRYVRDSWVSALAETGLVLLVLAVLQDERGPVQPPTWARQATRLPYLPVVAVLCLGAWLALDGAGLRPSELGLLVLVLAALVLRQVAGNRDHEALTHRLRERTALFRSLVTGSADFITLHALDGGIRYASPAVSRLTGLTEEELARVPLHELVHPEDLPAVARAGEAFRRSPGGETELLVRLRTRSGEWRWCRTLAHDLRHDSDVRGIVCNTRDVHERHLLEQQVQHDALHDALTGLGNLAQARARLRTACAADSSVVSTVLLVDLDGFKQVNDTYGHGQGDALLVAVAERLRTCVRATDTVTRTGGDEFLVVLLGDADGSAVAEAVVRALQEPFAVSGRPLTVGASVGLASTAGRPDPEELLRNADLAMYAAKAAGRNRWNRYRPQLHEDATRRTDIVRGLRRALDEEHLSLHYQPVVRLGDGELAAVEALLRWTPPDGGPVPPDVFLPVAAESSVMLDLDAWVLDRACRDLARWRSQGVAVPQVNVDVSRRHLTGALPDLVRSTLRRHGLDPADVCLEVTESAVAPDPRTAVAALTSLRRMGVPVALEEFGTGPSSLSQLVQLPLDAVKIDESFLPAVPEDVPALRLLGSLVDLCHALGLSVTAVGVAEPEVLQHLVGLGCSRAQGPHFARPQSAEDLAEAWLEGHLTWQPAREATSAR